MSIDFQIVIIVSWDLMWLLAAAIQNNKKKLRKSKKLAVENCVYVFLIDLDEQDIWFLKNPLQSP